MSWILGAICFLTILIVFMIVTTYFVLKRSSCSVHASKYILNKFELDNTAPKLTEMIEFHNNNKYLTRREQEIPHFYKWWDELR